MNELHDGAARGDERSKGDRTRRRLLDAAAAEIARRGPDATSLAGVARHAGLQPGSVYFHFPSRDALIAAVHEEGLRESLRILGAALATVPGHDDPVGRLRAAIRGHLEALHALHDYATVVLSPRFAPVPETASSHHPLRRRYVERWTELIAAAQASGALPADVDPREVCDLVIGALNAAGRAGRPLDHTAHALGSLLGLEPATATPATRSGHHVS